MKKHTGKPMRHTLFSLSAAILGVCYWLFPMQSDALLAVDPVTGIGLGIAGLGSFLQGIFGADAAEVAAKLQAEAANRGIDLQTDMFNSQRTDAMPWQGAGRVALSDLVTLPTGFLSPEEIQKQVSLAGDEAVKASQDSDKWRGLTALVGMGDDAYGVRSQLEAYEKEARDKAEQETYDRLARENSEKSLSGGGVNSDFTRDFTMDDFQKDPGYDFRMREGQKAIERSAAARGGLQTGGTLKALSRYGQDFASGEYQNAYNRFNADRDRRFNRLSSIAGLGQTANTQIGQAGQNYANNTGNILMSNANAQGAAQIAGANAWGNTLSGIGQMGMDFASMNQMDKWMNQWTKSQGAGGGGSYGQMQPMG